MMRPLVRLVAVALVAFGLTIPLAQAAGGEKGTASRAEALASAHGHGKARSKTKAKSKRKVRRATTAARGGSRLAFAAPGGDGLLDLDELPPPRAGMCPPEMASIEGRYCVDRWEASLVEVTGAGDAIFPYTSTIDGRSVRAVSVPGAFPQGYISGVEATQACANAGKRLCTRTEWRKACVGPRARQFGYGDARVHGRCNDSGRSPMRLVWGSTSDSPRDDWSPEKMNDPRLNALAGSLAKTGDHPDCTNEYGVFDMVGNLHEWTSDPEGTFQGGYYLDTSINGDGCAYRTTAHDFGYHDYSTGFRCCADPR